MRTLRIIGMAIVAIVMSVNFAACNDDDDDIDVNQLEGTWGLTHAEGYYYEEGEKESWDNPYDPENPTSDCEKVVISKGADGVYTMVHYEYYNSQWHPYETEKFTLDGNSLIPVEEDDAEVSSVKVLVANSTQLVIEIKGVDEDGDFYDKMTYKRM